MELQQQGYVEGFVLVKTCFRDTCLATCLIRGRRLGQVLSSMSLWNSLTESSEAHRAPVPRTNPIGRVPLGSQGEIRFNSELQLRFKVPNLIRMVVCSTDRP